MNNIEINKYCNWTNNILLFVYVLGNDWNSSESLFRSAFGFHTFSASTRVLGVKNFLEKGNVVLELEIDHVLAIDRPSTLPREKNCNKIDGRAFRAINLEHASISQFVCLNENVAVEEARSTSFSDLLYSQFFVQFANLSLSAADVLKLSYDPWNSMFRLIRIIQVWIIRRIFGKFFVNIKLHYDRSFFNKIRVFMCFWYL